MHTIKDLFENIDEAAVYRNGCLFVNKNAVFYSSTVSKRNLNNQSMNEITINLIPNPSNVSKSCSVPV